MPILDLMAVIGAIAVGLIGISAIRVMRGRQRADDPQLHDAEQRAAGARNVKQLELEQALEQARRCSVCEQPTDARVDLYIQDAWYHRTCYLALSAETLKENK